MAKLVKKKVVKKTVAKTGNKVSSSLLKRVKDNQKRAKGGPSFFKDGLDVEFYKPAEGQHEIDIIPFVMGQDSPIYRGNPVCEEGEYDYVLDLWVHFGLGSSGKQSCICLNKTYERKCPICEYANELRLEGRDEEADEVKAKRRSLYNVVSYDRGEEAKGVQIFSVSYHYMEKFLLKLAKRPVRQGRENVEPYINFAGIEAGEGKSISFEIEKGAKGSYDEWIGHSFVDRDYDIDPEILEQAHQLDQLLHIPTYDEAKSVLEGIDDEPESPDTEEEQEKAPSRPQRSAKPSVKNKPTARTAGKLRKPKDEPEPEEEEVVEEEVEEEDVEEEEVVEEEVAEEGVCPYGGEFGADIEELEQCAGANNGDGCENFDACFEAYQGMQEEPEQEPEPEKPARRGTKPAARGRARR